VRQALLFAAGAVAARAALSGVRAAPGGHRLERTNFRGRTVSLAAGPALALAASTTAGSTAALVAGLGSGAVGFYDDLVGGRPEHQAKGFRGHVGALVREGRVTSGLAKVAGVGVTALAAAALLPGRPVRVARGARRRRAGPVQARPVNLLLGAGVIAGTANLVNLLDLRPGRALKAGVLLGVPLGAAGPVGAAAALLPDDLGERTMLGDAGANALGAVLGVALAARTGPVGRALLLAGLAGLTAASERVSFTQVIERTPGLRQLDALGRRRT
jgi:UDP-N-acetylmuramyl pentapeptide phosphotransferase/UDP-N-acetylglucosamine-1-phosphate transferase